MSQLLHVCGQLGGFVALGTETRDGAHVVILTGGTLGVMAVRGVGSVGIEVRAVADAFLAMY